MREICTEVGMSAGGVYRYFKGKNEIIQEAIVLETAGLVNIVKKLDAKKDIVEALTSTVMTIIREFHKPGRARLYVELVSQSTNDPKTAQTFSASDAEIRKAFTGILKAAIKDGKISSDTDPYQVTQALIALMDGYSIRVLFDPDFDPDAIADTVRQIIENLIAKK